LRESRLQITFITFLTKREEKRLGTRQNGIMKRKSYKYKKWKTKAAEETNRVWISELSCKRI
jgi:hypothetical protein